MNTLVSPTSTDKDPSSSELGRCAIVARDGSELAEALRSLGWVARAGWRATTKQGETVWYLRFEDIDGDRVDRNR